MAQPDLQAQLIQIAQQMVVIPAILAERIIAVTQTPAALPTMEIVMLGGRQE